MASDGPSSDPYSQLPAAIAAAAADDLDAALSGILEVGARAVGSASTAIFLVDPDRPGLQLAASTGLAPDAATALAEAASDAAHPLAVASIELAIVLIEVDLLRRVGNALWDDHPPITAVEIGALDRAVVETGHAHVGPIDVASLRIDDDAVREMATGNDGFAVGSVRIH